MLLLQVLGNRGISRGVLPWVLICVPTLAMGDSPFDSLIACGEIASDTARLTCFDRELAEVKKKDSQPSRSVGPTAEQKFGLSEKQVLELGAVPDQAPTPKALQARVVNIPRYPVDRQVFVLDNAQSWQQIELDPGFVVRIGQQVTISKGALGSFWLSADSHRATRVKRIQ
jgi:hypothetical protein